MTGSQKNAAILAGSTGAGAGVGTGISVTLGRMGLAVGGTAFAVPVVAIFAGLGLVIGGVWVLRGLIHRAKTDDNIQ